MMSKNAIFFNRQIMIEKDLIDKSKGLIGKGVNRAMDT